MGKREMPRKQRSKRDSQERPGFAPSNWDRTIIGAVLITAAAIAVYWPALWGGFFLDDRILLTDNWLVKSPAGLWHIWFSTKPIDYWPITNSSFWFEWRLWGMAPLGYHVTNLALHVASVFMLWAVLRKLCVPGAFLASVFFAIHPVNVESVAWISQRKNLLALLFFLAAIWCYLNDMAVDAKGKSAPRDSALETENARNRSPFALNRWYWLSLAAFVSAMLSKGSAAVLPLVLMLLAWWQQKRLRFADIARLLPFFIVAIALTAVNVWFQSHGGQTAVRDVNIAQRLAGAAQRCGFI